MLERFLLVWLCLLSAVAFLWDRVPGPDVFAASAPYLGWLIAVTMLAIGSMLPRDEVRQVAGRWPLVLAGTALQYASMPLFAFALGRLFRLDEASLLGIVMAGCVPGAMASNVLTLNARGNVSYSVSLTASATLLSPLCVPLALWCTLGREIPPEKLAATCRSLLLTVVAPVIVGHLLSRRFGRYRAIAGKAGPLVANLTILWIIAVVVALNRERLHLTAPLLVAALACLNLLGYAAGYAGGRMLGMPEPMCRALTLEIGMQNAGLGTFLVLEHFGEADAAAIPTALYTFGCMLTGTLLARTWANRSSGG